MNPFLITALVCLIGVAYAGYGEVAPQDPVPYQPVSYIPTLFAYPSWTGRHHNHRGRHSRWNSRSSSHSHESKEHSSKKCNKCKRLGEFKLDGPKTVKPRIEYITPSDNCLRAIIRCPFNTKNWIMVVDSGDDDIAEILGEGNRFERVARCNKRGKYEASPIHGEPMEFSKVVCVEAF